MRKRLILLLALFSICAFSQDKPAERPGVSATAEQLSGKWIISKILNPKKVEFPAEKVSGSHFTFGDDGKYTAMIMGVEEKGDWKFGPENKSIQLSVNGVRTVWNILSLSDGELIMQKGIRGNTVIFTR